MNRLRKTQPSQNRAQTHDYKGFRKHGTCYRKHRPNGHPPKGLVLPLSQKPGKPHEECQNEIPPSHSKKQKTPKCRHGQKTGRHSRKRMFCPARLHLVRWECLCRRLIADSTVQTNRANHFGLWQGLRSKAYATGRCRRNPRLTLEAGFLWSNGGRLVF